MPPEAFKKCALFPDRRVIHPIGCVLYETNEQQSQSLLSSSSTTSCPRSAFVCHSVSQSVTIDISDGPSAAELNNNKHRLHFDQNPSRRPLKVKMCLRRGRNTREYFKNYNSSGGATLPWISQNKRSKEAQKVFWRE